MCEPGLQFLLTSTADFFSIIVSIVKFTASFSTGPPDFLSQYVVDDCSDADSGCLKEGPLWSPGVCSPGKWEYGRGSRNKNRRRYAKNGGPDPLDAPSGSAPDCCIVKVVSPENGKKWGGELLIKIVDTQKIRVRTPWTSPLDPLLIVV